jgi:hypothetical protein
VIRKIKKFLFDVLASDPLKNESLPVYGVRRLQRDDGSAQRERKDKSFISASPKMKVDAQS